MKFRLRFSVLTLLFYHEHAFFVTRMRKEYEIHTDIIQKV